MSSFFGLRLAQATPTRFAVQCPSSQSMKHETSESIDLLRFGYERGLHERATMPAGCGYASLLACLMWVYITVLIGAAAFLLGCQTKTGKWRWRDVVRKRVSPVASVCEETAHDFLRPESEEEEIRDESPSRVSDVSRAPSEARTVTTNGRRSEISTDAFVHGMQAGLRTRTATSRASSIAP